MGASMEIIKLIKGLSLSERLKVVEAILRSIREDEMFRKEVRKEEAEGLIAPAILTFAGIFNEEEASNFESAVAESRKIDEDAW